MMSERRQCWMAIYMTLLTILNAGTYGISINTESIDASNELHLLDTVVLPSLARKSPFVVYANLNLTALDFKGSDDPSNVASSPQIGRLKGDNKDLDSAVILHEIEDFASMAKIQVFKHSQAKQERTISRKFWNTESEKLSSQSIDRKHCKECHGGEFSKNITEIRQYQEPRSLNLLHTIVKRSNGNNSPITNFPNRNTRGHRIRKIRVAGFKMSNYGHKSSRYCPILPVDTRIIFNCSKGRKVGSKCSLSCAAGFVLTGKRKSRRCRKHRRKRRKHYYYNSMPYWSGKREDFQCVPVCKHLDVPEHGDRTCKMVGLPRGKALRCTTQCNRGYKMIGTLINTCMENGRWSGQPAVCKAASTRQTQSLRFEFREHQTLPCGEVYGLASFRRDGVVYLVAGDKATNRVKIYRWENEKFSGIPHQTFQFSSPEIVEVLTAPNGVIWLIVGGQEPVTMFRLDPNGIFQRSHTTPLFGGKPTVGDTIGFAELGGEFYRCYGRNRRETPVIVVHKLQDKRTQGDGDVFTRITRKKLPGEQVHQCSMYTEGDSLYAVATLKKPDGQDRIMVGQLTKKRMKIVDVIEGKNMRHLSDSLGFKTEGHRYIVVSQGTVDGKCIIYKRHWWIRPLETG